MEYKDTIYEIFLHLNPYDIVNCKRVCKLWNDISKHPDIDISKNKKFYIFKINNRLTFNASLNKWMKQPKYRLKKIVDTYPEATTYCQAQNDMEKYKIGCYVWTKDGIIWRNLFAE